MLIKNYTTTVSVDKTLGEIQGMLAKHGARSISVDYDGQGTPIGLSFCVRTQDGDGHYLLPANTDAIYKVLEREWQRGSVRRGLVSEEQAARVGWRIIRDWVAAQLAIIQAGMVTLDRVFFPYLLGDGEHTVYDLYVEHRKALPKPEA